jgi:hypothetical protein
MTNTAVSAELANSQYKNSEVENASDEEEFKQYVKDFKFSWIKLLKFAGPGLLMSIAYLDPGNSKLG